MPVSQKRALRAAPTRSALVAVGGLVTLALVALFLSRYGLSTLAVTHAAVRDWLGGAELYAYREPVSGAGVALPPALAILLAPLALLPLKAAGWLLALAGVAALLLATVVLAGPVARRHGRRRTPLVLAAAALALLTEPVRAALGEGRPELLLFGLVVADLVALRRARAVRAGRVRRTPCWLAERPGPLLDRLRQGWADGTWAGIGTGLAAAFAVTPLFFLAGLMVLRRRRAAVTALTTAVTVTLAGLLFAPRETVTWFGDTLWELNRTDPLTTPGNQALAGVLARLYGCPAPPVLVWLSFGAVLLAAGLFRARSALGAGDEVAAFTVIGLAAAAFGPMSTPAELIWLLPALLILADTGRPVRRGVAAAGYALLVVPVPVLLGWNVYAFALILLTGALPWRTAPAPPAPPQRVAIPVPRGG
ncbi:glycosyltransferase 87 family protein [Actinoplanes oblitus]|uniref:Glycosyltransferase 87 family protein n=1 Tax=Actinoplanes oblitus TaxID=3040509 RepID=A0ABY8WI50_9ACTN|nr:glycosyltransferase 87 family protein [Actinoplanes oblitus]WIM96515.1 glycosyltransferase 87 family protein [Actinoplanes oblitus]